MKDTFWGLQMSDYLDTTFTSTISPRELVENARTHLYHTSHLWTTINRNYDNWRGWREALKELDNVFMRLQWVEPAVWARFSLEMQEWVDLGGEG